MLKNMKVKKSLILGYALVILISLAIIVTSIFMMVNQRKQYESLLDEDVQVNQFILYARLNAVMAGRNYRDAMLIPDSEANAGLIETAENCLTTAEDYIQKMYDMFPYQLSKEKLDAYNTAFRNWETEAKQIISLYKQYDSTKNEQYLREAENLVYTTDTPLQNSMATAAEALDTYLVEGMDAERAKIERSVMVTLIIIVVAMVVATCFVIAFALVLIKSITGPTEEVRNALVGFSQGKLDIPVKFESKNELGEMCDALRESQRVLNGVIQDEAYLLGEMARGNFALRFRDESLYVGALAEVKEAITKINHNLSDTLTQINLSAEQVSAGSEQVSTGAQSLAQGATEQASAVEELSATVSEISSNSQNNAKRSASALQQANYTKEQLDESAQNMEEMVRAMDRISESSQEISKIIATIENIAFQTNILALNAAVEAARAGAAGKGFAVVADEVRNLSAKSDQAAKATKELIDHSIASVQDGNKIVERVSESLQKTVDATKELMTSIDDIARAVEEEAESIAQVTEGIDQISSVVQTNSATSEESAATSEELSSQASMMKSMMAQFKLRSTDDEFRAPGKVSAFSYGAQNAEDVAGGAGSVFAKY